MTAVVRTAIQCDLPVSEKNPLGCINEFVADHLGIGETRERAARHGWVKIGRRDFCTREHAEEATR